MNKDGFLEYDLIENSEASMLNVADHDYFQAAIAGHTFVTGVTEHRTDHEPVVLFSAPIWNELNDIDGIIVGTAALHTLRSIINTLQLGETGHLYLTDPSRLVLSRTDETSPLTLSDTDVFKHARLDEPQLNSYENAAGDTVIGQYLWIHNGKWLLIGEMDTTEMNIEFWHSLFVIGGILLFVFLIAFVVIRLLIQQIIFPIDKLLEGTVILRLGNYNHRISDQVHDESLDEFKALHSAYNEMARSLDREFSLRQQAEKELRQANERLKQLSFSDSLTGIGNRRYFDEVLERSFKESA
nr:cache domain-containing protein [Domibacillus aminovorans]